MSDATKKRKEKKKMKSLESFLMVCLSLLLYSRLGSIVSKSRIDICCLNLLIAREQLC